MKSLLQKLLPLALVLAIGVVTLPPSTASAADDPRAAASLETQKEAQKGVTAIGGGTGGAADLNDAIKTIVNVLLFLIGAISVIMIIIGGIKYTTSNGDSSQVTSAKNTILYAVIGLVVALLAFAIVNFVLRSFK